MMELLRATSGFLADYGGHRTAAGFSVLDGCIGEFVRETERFAHENYAGRIERDDVLRADAIMPLTQCPADIARLEPFGEGNRPPVLQDCRVTLQRSGVGWSPEGRPEFVLRPSRSSVRVAMARPVAILYTMDDCGTQVLLDVAPAAGAAE